MFRGVYVGLRAVFLVYTRIFSFFFVCLFRQFSFHLVVVLLCVLHWLEAGDIGMKRGRYRLTFCARNVNRVGLQE